MLGDTLENVRKNVPLVHNITNYVTVNDVANVLLAAGGSPIMSDEPEDVEDITTICGGLNINIGTLKEKRYEDVLNEIKAVRAACEGKILKVIIETCLLSDEEITKMCDIVSRSGADYIKTSTGFSKGGATHEDIILMKNHVKNGLKIKAAGGIASLEDAARFLEEGADRLGTSRIVKIVKEMK